MKTTTQPKKLGRPVGSKKNLLTDYMGNTFENITQIPDSEATVEQVKDWSRFKPQGETVEEMSLVNKITLVLTVVNVAILISLVIKNVWMNF